MDNFSPDFGMALTAAGRRNATVSFSRIPLPHLGRIDAATFCSTVDLAMERRYAVTFDFDLASLRAVLALAPRTLASSLSVKFGKPFREPEMVEFSSPLVVAIQATVGEPIENGDEQYAPLRVVAVTAATATTSIEIADHEPTENTGHGSKARKPRKRKDK